MTIFSLAHLSKNLLKWFLVVWLDVKCCKKCSDYLHFMFLFYIWLILFRMVWWWPVRSSLLVSRLSSRRSTGNIQGGCTLFDGSIFTLPSFSWKIAFSRDTGRYCFILRLAQFALTCYCNISNNVYSNTGTYRCQDIHNPQLFIEKTVSVLCK